MLIKDKEKYTESLVALWHKVFGDEEDYIRLFFGDVYYDSECFAVIDNNEAVSALYLLKCKIRCGDRIYSGRYLYAAATLPEYRGKGLMSELIEEAKAYAKSEKLDFIALVPAGDSLYGYYENFGFVTAMYKHRIKVNKTGKSLRNFRQITDHKEFYDIRSSYDGDYLIYDETASQYAFSCLGYYGSRIYLIDEKSYYIDDEELFIADSCYADSADTFISSVDGEVMLYSNCQLQSSEKVRNGMIYYLNDEFKNKEIYMNIALD